MEFRLPKMKAGFPFITYYKVVWSIRPNRCMTVYKHSVNIGVLKNQKLLIFILLKIKKWCHNILSNIWSITYVKNVEYGTLHYAVLSWMEVKHQNSGDRLRFFLVPPSTEPYKPKWKSGTTSKRPPNIHPWAPKRIKRFKIKSFHNRRYFVSFLYTSVLMKNCGFNSVCISISFSPADINVWIMSYQA